MGDRPYLLYEQTFKNGAYTLVIRSVGQTPCRAKGAAFTKLEAEIKVQQQLNPAFPARGWRLHKQEHIKVAVS